MPPSLYFERIVRLQVTPEALWSLVANTDKFNHALGLASVSYRFEPSPTGGSRMFARTRMVGLTLEWEERPFEWTRPRGFEVERIFQRGPLAKYRFGMRIESDAAGAKAVVFGEFTPKNGFVAPVVRIVARQQTERFAGLLERLAKDGEHPTLPAGAIQADENAIRTTAEIVGRDVAAAHQPILAALVNDLLRASDRDVVGIRPFVWADARGLPAMATLEVFLRATRAGLLDMEWALRCPHCRGRPLGVQALADLPEAGDCGACAARFAVELDRAVETRFTPSPRVRQLEAGMFCAGGPMNRPFIWAQCRIPPGGEREIAGALPVGAYRVSLWGRTAAALFVREGDADAALSLPTEPSDDAPPERVAGAEGTLRLRNQADHEVTVAVESASWEDRSASAALVSTLQLYQELFATDVLAAGQEIAIRRIVVLFSDLRGSTALYQELGDARAYAVVRDHFWVFEEILSAHEGVLVKTIGDAVMAVFARAKDAVAAADEAHRRMSPPVVLRIGIHVGPVLAVRSNRRNDYFGSTVNLASRLEHVAQSGETVISADVADEAGETGARETVRLKGIDAPAAVVRRPNRAG